MEMASLIVGIFGLMTSILIAVIQQKISTHLRFLGKIDELEKDCFELKKVIDELVPFEKETENFQNALNLFYTYANKLQTIKDKVGKTRNKEIRNRLYENKLLLINFVLKLYKKGTIADLSEEEFTQIESCQKFVDDEDLSLFITISFESLKLGKFLTYDNIVEVLLQQPKNKKELIKIISKMKNGQNLQSTHQTENIDKLLARWNKINK